MKLQLLFLTHIWRRGVNTIFDHAKSFSTYSQHEVHYFDPLQISKPSWLPLHQFDVILIHYPVYLFNDSSLNESWRDGIRASSALKILFVQDEYRQVNTLHSIINDLKIDVLYTCIPEPEIENVYPGRSVPGLVKINTLTGYVPEYLENKRHFSSLKRDIDVGYRGRGIGFWWLGSLFQEKFVIAETFRKTAPRYNLSVDISNQEEDRLSGGKWLDFLKCCRATLGTESGASVIDFTGEIERSVKEYIIEHPDATFEDVKFHCFEDLDGRITMNQISPRLFEAIGCGTALILFTGSYSGILKPGQHFIELKKDFSNMDEVVHQLRDDGLISCLTETAYQDIIASQKYSYLNFIESVDRDIQDILAKKHFSFLGEPGLSEKRRWLFLPFFLVFYFGRTIVSGLVTKIAAGIFHAPAGTLRSLAGRSAHLLNRLRHAHSLTKKGGLTLFLKSHFRLIRRRTRRAISISGQPDFERTDFWDEICGSSSWTALGLSSIDEQSLKKFDDWYLNDIYPYLKTYLPPSALDMKDVLEIGIGFGTVGSWIAGHAGTYTGLDSSHNPVRLLRQRINWEGTDGSAGAVQGDARGLPFKNETFHFVVSIGCLHHAGDVEKSVQEVYRVLRPGGRAVIMLYNKKSFRNVLSLPIRYVASKLSFTRKRGGYQEFRRAAFDCNSQGQAPPVTEFFSKREAGILFDSFGKVSISTENFTDLNLIKKIMPRKLILRTLGRLWGLDLYITAIK